VNILTKLQRWLRPPADVEAEAEKQRQRAERENSAIGNGRSAAREASKV
jgi:hypothetical protein